MESDRVEFQEILDRFEEGASSGREATALENNIDAIDEVFLSTVSKETRSENEQFLTPPEISRFLVNWCIQSEGRSFLDPAVGTGRFVSDAIDLTENMKICGFDIDPLMTRSSQIRSDSKASDQDISIMNKDFLDVNFPDKYSSIVCNPPFKKFKEYENAGRSDWLKARYGIDIGKQANLFVAFLIHSYSFLENNGRAAFITPNEYIYANYGDEVKGFLLNNFRIEAVVMLDFDGVFEDVLTTPVITLLSKKKKGKTKFLRLQNWPGHEELNKLLSTGDGDVNEVPQREIVGSDNWMKYFTEHSLTSSENLREFSSIADIKRGIATGYNDYFLLNESDISDWNLSPSSFERVAAKSNYCENLVLTKDDLHQLEVEDKPTYLLYNVGDVGDQLRKYIDHGVEIEADDRYLTSNRNTWYEVERREVAPILATTFSRGDMRFVWNRAGVRNLTAFHSIYPPFSDEDKTKAFLSFLNSGVFESMMDIEMRVHGGLGKFEPNDLKRLEVLDISSLSQSYITKLSCLFDNLEKSWRTDDGIESVKNDIDGVIQDLI